MLFWKKKPETIIQCPRCEWQPDGEKHWACGCGYSWNTFETKGKCPSCKKQWADTRCPGCGQMSPHKDWYKTPEEIEAVEKSANTVLRAKKKSLESRLIDYGIKNYRVSHLEYLDYSKAKLHSPYDAGCRMIILYAISYLAHKLEDRPAVCNWLQSENLWDKVSPSEKEFLSDPSPSEETRQNLSWYIETAITLAWCLTKVSSLPRLDIEGDDKTMDEFQENVPALGEPLAFFLSTLEYRSLDEIYEENLLNEMAATYFRDLLFNGKKDETKINRIISYERHKVLNWLNTQYVDESLIVTGELWDDVDTST
ncbi:protein of unknown function [Ohtaekwangia koreensis]|uniref:DUF4272 domain-containing protein n=2 Tax=Ohtaekwangia koreensis TaxID=688867 RepID=A0A1T5LST7_9BACT|nr:protein of unknown function [Ohtaekwangia koreensis]